MRVTMTVDGVGHVIDVEPGCTLAEVLVAHDRLADVRVACADGTCGFCTVVLDGEALRTCLMLAVQADGAHVRTVGSQPD